MAVSENSEGTSARAVVRMRDDFQRRRGGRPAPMEVAAVWGGGAFATFGIGLWILSGRRVDWIDMPTIYGPWVSTAALFAIAGGLHVLRELGPLQTDAATTHWLVSSPLARDELLRSRFLAGSAISAVTGVVIARSMVSFVDTSAWWPYATIGAAIGVGVFSICVLGQAVQRMHALSKWSEAVVVVVGLLVGFTGFTTSVIPVVALCVLVAFTLWISAFRFLGKVRRSTLTAGSSSVAAGTAAVSRLDAGIFTASVEQDIFRRRGSVRSSRLRANRVQAMVMADALRHTRNRWAVAVLGFAVLMSIVAPSILTPVTGSVVVLVVTYFGTLAASTGLRDVAQSGALRFELGARDKLIYLAHCVVPTTASIAMGMFISAESTWLTGTVIAVGVAMAVFRRRMFPLSDSQGLNLITTFGVIPVNIIRQQLRGPDVLVLASFALLWL